MDQSPMVRNTPEWRWGLFGHSHHARMMEFRELIETMEQQGRDRPWKAIPSEIRDRLWVALARFMADAFHSLPLSLGSIWLLKREMLGRQVLPPDNWGVYLDCMRSYLERDYDMRQSLENIDLPMTVFVGMNSVMYPPAGQLYIGEQVKHAKVVRFNNCGHAIPLEAPLRFSRELSRFLLAA
jgi:pimeloyl-ACP methyl ester carboxylesterase